MTFRFVNVAGRNALVDTRNRWFDLGTSRDGYGPIGAVLVSTIEGIGTLRNGCVA